MENKIKGNHVLQLPADFYPACWQDDERMDNLLSPFRSKAVNSVNYESKMKFWTNLIKEYCQVKGCAVITVNELRDAFRRNDKKPFCLDTVIENQLMDGTIQRKNNFSQPPQHTWSGWAMHKFIKSPLQWSFDKVKERVVPATKPSAGDTNFDGIEFVVLEVVKSHAEQLINHFNSVNDCLTVISMDELIKMLSESTELNSDGVEVALHYLHCQQKASIQKTTVEQKEVILCKLAVAWNRHVEPITPLDVSIYTLRKMEKSLTKSVEAIETDVEHTDTQVRQYIRDKKKQLAQNFLRKKHMLERNLAKSSNALTTIQTLLLQMDDTSHNAKIVEALKMSTKTLKNALDDKNITIDNVDDALADVKEILEKNADIQFALSDAQFSDILNDGVTDEESLEAELMDLLEDVSEPADNTSSDNKPGFHLNVAPTTVNGNPTLPPGVVSAATSGPNISPPATITNVIDDLLEERLKKLQLGNTINVTIDSNAHSNVDKNSTTQSAIKH